MLYKIFCELSFYINYYQKSMVVYTQIKCSDGEYFNFTSHLLLFKSEIK